MVIGFVDESKREESEILKIGNLINFELSSVEHFRRGLEIEITEIKHLFHNLEKLKERLLYLKRLNEKRIELAEFLIRVDQTNSLDLNKERCNEAASKLLVLDKHKALRH